MSARAPDAYQALADALALVIADIVARVVADTPTQPGGEALVSVTDAAHRLAVSPATVKRLIAAGGLPSLSVGRRRLVPLAALQAFAATRAS
jgi:excisionase family DNA binding protein